MIPGIMAGLIVGMTTATIQISLGTLMFSGALSPYLASGVGLSLVGALLMGIVVAATSSWPGSIAIPQDATAAILALMLASIVGQMGAEASRSAIFSTINAAIVLTSLLTGMCFFVLGRFRLGRLLRFVPYPVVGGFLAGTGWLLARGALGVMTSSPLGIADIPLLFEGRVLQWLPGLCFAILLLAISRRFNHFLLLPAMIFLSSVLFYGALWLTQTSIAAANAQGLLLQIAGGADWQPLTPAALAQVDWPAILGQISKIGTIIFISVIALLLNASGLELMIQQDIDLNRELRAAGLANIIAGIGGSPAGYQALSLSALGYRIGGSNRMNGFGTALVCGLVLLFGSAFLTFVPKLILGGLLLYLGLSLLIEWLYDAWFKLPAIDYVLVLLIFLISAGVGFLEGIVAGLCIAVAVFVLAYTRINVVKHVFSGASYQSRVTRPPQQRQRLRELGEQLYILQLQGFIFFGTAHTLLDQVRARTAGHPGKLRFVVLDFRQVSGLDSTGVLSFIKMKQGLSAQGIELVLSHLSPAIQRQLHNSDFGEGGNVQLFPDLDRATEWCEQQLLPAEALAIDEKRTLYDYLYEIIPQSAPIAQMLPYFEQQRVAPGDYIIHQGDAPEAIYFIESGQVTARTEAEGQPPVRIETMRGGRVVGELGFYLGNTRSASVVADEPSTIYRLTQQDLRRMEQADPAGASVFHQIIVRLVAERTIHLMGVVDALQR